MFPVVLLAAAFTSIIIFLAYIYPNMKKPRWERKIVSANYLRVRNRGELADDVLIDAIQREPHAWKLYQNLFAFYATPWNMKKLYDVLSFGVKTTDNPGLIAITAWCLIEEGEFEEAEKMLKREEVEDALLEYCLNYLPLLYFKQERYKECEEAFVSFYKKIYVTGLAGDPNESNENKIFADLSPEELVILVIARKKLDKNWRAIAQILLTNSVHEEKNWTTYYEKLLKQKDNLRVDTGIYGPPEKLLSLREKELDARLEAVKEHLKIK